MSYELGYFLEERLKPLAIKSRVPLAYFGIYKNPEELSINPEFSEKEFEILKNGFGNFKIGIEKEEYIKAIKKLKITSLKVMFIKQILLLSSILSLKVLLKGYFIYSFFLKGVNLAALQKLETNTFYHFLPSFSWKKEVKF